MKKRDVMFYSRGEKIVGTVYLPDDYTEGTKIPAIIPCSGYTGINAAYPTLLAEFFTQYGYGCLGFDYRGWLPSDGKVGVTTAEDWYFDIEAAYMYAQQVPEFQEQNVGLFGWGFSAPVVLKLAANYPEIKAVGCGNGVYNGKRCLKSYLAWEDYTKIEKIIREDAVERAVTGEGATTDAYQQMGHGVYYAYLSGNKPDLTREWMVKENPLAYRKQSGRNKTFMNLETTREAIQNIWNGEFPPRQSFAATESFLRIDASLDAQKISPRKIFVVHAIEDDTYPADEAYCFAEEVGPRCVSCFVHGDHNSFMFPDNPEFIRFASTIIGYYDEALKA